MINIDYLYKDKSQLQSYLRHGQLHETEKTVVRVHLSIQDSMRADAIVREIHEELPQAVVIAFPVSGIIYNGQQYEDSTLVSILQFESAVIDAAVIDFSNKEISELADEIMVHIPANSLAFMFMGGMYSHLNELVAQLTVIRPECILYGGVSGYQLDEGTITSFICDVNGMHEHSIAIISIDDPVLTVYSNTIIGHTPISDVHIITDTHTAFRDGDEGTIIETIDHRYSADWLKDQLGLDRLMENWDWNEKEASDILMNFPLTLEETGGSSRFVRFDSEDEALYVLHSAVENGQAFRISYVSPLQSAEEWQRVCFDLQQTPAQVMLCYSCVFRKIYLSNLSRWELTPFASSGLSGAFLLGEIGFGRDASHYYHGSSCILTLGDGDTHITPNLKAFDDLVKLEADNKELVDRVLQIQGRSMIQYKRTLLQSLLNQEDMIRKRLTGGDDSTSFGEEYRMVQILSEAIRQEGIVPYFQGIYDNEHGVFNGYEALMRIRGADGQVYLPDQFMETAKKYHLYTALSQCMIRKVFELCANMPVNIGINLSTIDIGTESTRRLIFSYLASLYSPEHFIFEILESESISDLTQLRSFIQLVKQYGVGIAVDDFGSGYSNFLELGNIDIDYIKISGTLTRLMGTDSSYDRVIESISYLSRNTGVAMIAEYVETAAIQNYVVKHGIRYSQGYFFSKPISYEELKIQLAEKMQGNRKLYQHKVYMTADKRSKAHARYNRVLTVGSIVLAVFTVCMILIFSRNNKSQVESMSETFLVELSTNMASHISEKVVDSSSQLITIEAAVEKYMQYPAELDAYLKKVEKNALFDDLYVVYPDTSVISSDVAGFNIKNPIGDNNMAEGTIMISKPLTDEDGNSYITFNTPVVEDSIYKGQLFGVFYLKTFADVLNVKNFGGNAFYHLCFIDGTPVIVSDNSNNYYAQGQNMYDFIRSFDIKNGYDSNSIFRELSEKRSCLIKYTINNENRIAVLAPVAQTKWCVVSIAQNTSFTDLVGKINTNTMIFVLFIITAFVIYTLISLILASRLRRDLAKSLDQSRHLANSLQASVENDSLTRTYSRATAMEKISDAIKALEENHMKHALLIADVDDFKKVNDTYGHQTGDLLLQEVVSAIKSSLRAGDIIGRLGGDEFIVLLYNIEDEKMVKHIAKSILNACGQVTVSGTIEDHVSVSLGIAMVPSDSSDYETLYNMADSALYRAKENGKKRYELYSENNTEHK